MWKQTEYGVLPFVGFSSNIKLANTPADLKAMKDTKFDFDSFVEEKIFVQSAKYQPKTVVYCPTLNKYVTILRNGELEDSFVCRVR